MKNPELALRGSETLCLQCFHSWKRTLTLWATDTLLDLDPQLPALPQGHRNCLHTGPDWFLSQPIVNPSLQLNSPLLRALPLPHSSPWGSTGSSVWPCHSGFPGWLPFNPSLLHTLSPESLKVSHALLYLCSDCPQGPGLPLHCPVMSQL